MYLIGQEGQIIIREINIAVSWENGKYIAIEAVYFWRTKKEFSRFMPFANRYANNIALHMNTILLFN